MNRYCPKNVSNASASEKRHLILLRGKTPDSLYTSGSNNDSTCGYTAIAKIQVAATWPERQRPPFPPSVISDGILGTRHLRVPRVHAQSAQPSCLYHTLWRGRESRSNQEMAYGIEDYKNAPSSPGNQVSPTFSTTGAQFLSSSPLRGPILHIQLP